MVKIFEDVNEFSVILSCPGVHGMPEGNQRVSTTIYLSISLSLVSTPNFLKVASMAQISFTVKANSTALAMSEQAIGKYNHRAFE